MKRKFMAIIIVVLILLSLPSCQKTEPIVISGEVITSSQIEYGYFLMDTGSDKYAGIVISEDTKIDYADYRAPISDYYVVSVECGEIVSEEVWAYIPWREYIGNWYSAEKITVTDYCPPVIDTSQGFGKPVIYLYPEEETGVTVTLDFGGELICTYPKSDGTWSVTAKPDGTLTDENGMEYNYLFWEGESVFEFDFSKGFCVKGEDTAEFLETALAQLGLTRREANEFIVYWLPLMEANEYNVVSFQGDNYEEHAKLAVAPTPDTIIRVYMAWYGAKEEVDIEPQKLTAPEREGFTVIEWGGTELK